MTEPCPCGGAMLETVGYRMRRKQSFDVLVYQPTDEPPPRPRLDVEEVPAMRCDTCRRLALLA